MKISKIFAAVAVAVLFASCGSVGGMATGTSTASTNGQSSGAALKSLYSQYKTDGKIDVSNINNVMSMVALANGIQGLKGMDDKSAFYRDFAAGLILGSNNLISNNNSSAITGLLGGLANQDLSALTGAASKAAGNALTGIANSAISSAASSASSTFANISEKTEGVAKTVSTLSSIFGMLN